MLEWKLGASERVNKMRNAIQGLSELGWVRKGEAIRCRSSPVRGFVKIFSEYKIVNAFDLSCSLLVATNIGGFVWRVVQKGVDFEPPELWIGRRHGWDAFEIQ